MTCAEFQYRIVLVDMRFHMRGNTKMVKEGRRISAATVHGDDLARARTDSCTVGGKLRSGRPNFCSHCRNAADTSLKCGLSVASGSVVTFSPVTRSTTPSGDSTP